jgi:nucleoside-diphosphate-sugar epimerase
LNIQGRLTNKGFKIFEINPRFTGITGLRALMGFNEVEICIKDWLSMGKSYETPHFVFKKFGIRQITDKAVSFDRNQEVLKLSECINEKTSNHKKNVLVTGANGYLGCALIKKLVNEKYNVLALCRNKPKDQLFCSKYSENIEWFDLNDYYSGNLNFGVVDTLIHCAFSKPHRTKEEITDSLAYSRKIFTTATKYQIPSVINISSQSVYGTRNKFKMTEQTNVSPETFYALAKYSSELMAENINSFNKHSNVTSLRLSTLSGGQSGLITVDFLSKFVLKAIKNEPIEIIDGSQLLQRMDVRDAAGGISKLLGIDSLNWNPVYNLGVKEFYTVLEMAEKVSNIAKNNFGLKVQINRVKGNIPLSIILDSEKYYKLTQWQPKYSIDNIIHSLFDYFLEKKGL